MRFLGLKPAALTTEEAPTTEEVEAAGEEALTTEEAAGDVDAITPAMEGVVLQLKLKHSRQLLLTKLSLTIKWRTSCVRTCNIIINIYYSGSAI